MNTLLVRHAMVTEAIHSTAMEHPRNCGCLTCRAADGDREALAQIHSELLTAR